MLGGGTVGNIGKGFGVEGSLASLINVTIARCDLGLESWWGAVDMVGCLVLGTPDEDGVVMDDDNDAIRITGASLPLHAAAFSSQIQHIFLPIVRTYLKTLDAHNFRSCYFFPPPAQVCHSTTPRYPSFHIRLCCLARTTESTKTMLI